MKLAARELDGRLRRGLGAHAWLVVGDEPLLRAEATERIRDTARVEGFGERELHVVERGFDWQALGESARTMSLFAERRIIEVRMPSPRPGDAGGKALARLAEDPGDDTLVLVEAPKLDASAARTAWVKAFEKHGVLVQVWPLEPAQLPQWIGARMRAAGLVADSDAVQLLASRCEGNLLAARQEIEKLGLLLGQGAKVSVEAVQAAAADSARFDVFRLVDVALDGNAARALRVLDGLRREGVEPVLISWALSRELGSLVRLARAAADMRSADRALEAARVWPRRRPLVKKALQRHDTASLIRLQQLAAHVDRCIKGAAPGHPWMLLTEAVTHLSRPDFPLTQMAALEPPAAAAIAGDR